MTGNRERTDCPLAAAFLGGKRIFVIITEGISFAPDDGWGFR